MDLPRPFPPATSPRPAPAQPALPASALFQGRNVLVIDHGGERYQLRLTKSGKLILTK